MSSTASRMMALTTSPSQTAASDGYSVPWLSAQSPPVPVSPSAFAASSPPFTRAIRQFSLTRPPSYGSLGSTGTLSPSADYSSYLDLLQWPTSPDAPSAAPPGQPQPLPSQPATAFSSLAMSVPIPPVRSGAQPSYGHSQSHAQTLAHTHNHSSGQGPTHEGGVAALFPSTAPSSTLPPPPPSASALSPFVAGSTSSAHSGGAAPSMDANGRAAYHGSLLGKREREYNAAPDGNSHRPPPQPVMPATFHTSYPPYSSLDNRQSPPTAHTLVDPAYASAPITREPSPSPTHAVQLMPPTQTELNPIVYRKSSCLLCHRAKTSCDGRRPCDRCIRLDRQHLCVERVRPRGGTNTKKKSAGKKEKKGAEEKEEDKDEEEEDEEGALKREGAEEEEMADDHTAKSDDNKSTKVESSSTASTSPLPRVHSATRQLVTTGSPSPTSSSSFGSDPLVGVDERELSSTFLRVLQSDQVSVQSLLKQASVRKSVPPMAFQALISYIANSLHPDDFAAFLNSLDPNGDNSRVMEKLAVDRLHVKLPDGRLMPRVLFTFRKSSLDALPDSERGVDMAMIFVYRVPAQPKPILFDHAGEAADKTKSVEEEGGGKGQKEDAASSAHAAAATSPAPPTSPNPNTPAGQHSIKSTDSDMNDPLSPNSVSTTSSASSSSSSATSTSSVAATPASASLVAPPLAAPHTAASEAYAPFVPEPVPGANFDSLSEVDLVIQVNREFERLFGYSQREMKDLMMREQAKGLYRLYTPQSLLQLGRWLTEACTGVKTEFKAIVTIVNKWKGQTSCVLSARFILDPLGFFSSVCYAYTPLPENIVVK